jgi:Zn-dependent protease with chaperone function
VTVRGASLVTRWFDGHSPRARPASVHLEGEELLVLCEDDSMPRRYPLSGVRWPERRSHGQRQTELPDGSLLQHADSAEWDHWWASQGLLETRVVGWMQSWRATLAAAAGTVAFLAAAWVWGVPVLSNTLAHMVPQSMERGIGRQGMEQLERLFLAPSTLPTAEQEAVRTRFAGLLQRAHPDGGLPQWQLSFHASKALGANAFALPGGIIVMTDELVVMLRDQPDAISGVLAHELGHVVHRHGLDLLVRASLVSAMAGVVLGDASGFLATVPVTLVTQAYSRDAEREADEFAALTLDRAGIAPAVMVAFFERIARQSPAEGGDADKDSQAGEPPDRSRSSGLPIAISSHPDVDERVRFFRDWR